MPNETEEIMLFIFIIGGISIGRRGAGPPNYAYDKEKLNFYMRGNHAIYFCLTTPTLVPFFQV